ncbi:MAG: hypothetical protein M3345_01775 [Actinomycetota bacterium]|nr:hypothetical protein [Actinomycetota bacterium]
MCLAFAWGVVAGPTTGLITGLALITFGKGLVAGDRDRRVVVGSLAVMASSLVVGALRWRSFELDQIRGAQAVLGPAPWVGPVSLAVASGLAAAAFVIAAASWIGSTREAGLRWPWFLLEGAVAATCVTTMFWVAPIRSGALSSAYRSGVPLAIAVVLMLLGWAVTRLPPGWRWVVLAVAATGAASAGGLTAVSL